MLAGSTNSLSDNAYIAQATCNICDACNKRTSKGLKFINNTKKPLSKICSMCLPLPKVPSNYQERACSHSKVSDPLW